MEEVVVVEDIDIFASLAPTSPAQSSTPTELNITSECNVTTHSQTQQQQPASTTTEMSEASQQALFGDLPPELRKTRASEEMEWLMGTRPFLDATSGKPLKPDNTIIVGPNGGDGELCFALVAGDRTGREVLGPQDLMISGDAGINEKEEHLTTTYGKLRTDNPVVDFKCHCLELERAALCATIKDQLDRLASPKDVMDFLKLIDYKTKADLSLRKPFRLLGPEVTKKLKNVETTSTSSPSPPSAKSAPRPGNSYCAIHTAQCELVDATTVESSVPMSVTDKSVFYLYVCRTPLAANSAGGRGKWKMIFSIDSHISAVPCVVVNKTHVLILVMPPAPLRKPPTVHLYRIDDRGVDDGGRIKLTKESAFHVEFPRESFGTKGFVTASMDDDCIVSVAMGRGVLVFDALRRRSPNVHQVWLRWAPSSPLETPAEGEGDRFQRVITSTRIVHNGDVVLMGTDAGECYAVNWLTGKVKFVKHTHAVEPILGLAYKPGLLVMMCVMNLTIFYATAEGDSAAYESVDRPIDVAICGTLIFALTKYGSIKCFSGIKSDMLRDIPPPDEVAKKRSFVNQFSYKALHATHDRIVCVYPQGVVRSLSLAPEAATTTTTKNAKKK